MSDKVLYTDVELTIHQSDPVLGSKTLLPGQFIALADLSPYEREAATQGKIAGIQILTEAEAKLLLKQTGVMPLAGAQIDSGEEETQEPVIVGKPTVTIEDSGVVSKIESE